MGDFWTDYWWMITLFLILIGSGGVAVSRNKKGDDDTP